MNDIENKVESEGFSLEYLHAGNHEEFLASWKPIRTKYIAWR